MLSSYGKQADNISVNVPNSNNYNHVHNKFIYLNIPTLEATEFYEIMETLPRRIRFGLCLLCGHNLRHNRHANASSIMLA